MANNYDHAAFGVVVTAPEAQLIAAVEAAIGAIEETPGGRARREASCSTDLSKVPERRLTSGANATPAHAKSWESALKPEDEHS